MSTHSSSTWNRCLEHVARSHVGLRRANNQDSYAVSLASDWDDWYQRGHLLVVADGMGAHAAGELASKLAVEQVTHVYRKQRELSPPEAIAHAIREANSEIHRRGQANLDFHNMGTTCSALLLLPQGALAAHVGDSRIYRLRGNRLFQLTFDHSLVWEMMEAGQLREDDDQTMIPKNVITRSLGPHPSVVVDLEGPFPLEVGDTFLLCSDGLTGRVTDEEIATAISALPPAAAADLLTNLANLRGGPDNITVLIAKVTGPDMTSRMARAAPLRVGESQEPPASIPPQLLIGFGVALLAAGASAAMSHVWWACLLLAIGLVLGIVILTLKFDLLRSAGTKLAGGRRLGKGPYRRAHSASAAQLAAQLQNGLRKLREFAAQQFPDCDWTEIDRESHLGESCLEHDEVETALEHFCRACHLQFEQCRESIRQASTDLGELS